jgi:hypothetical protein
LAEFEILLTLLGHPEVTEVRFLCELQRCSGGGCVASPFIP